MKRGDLYRVYKGSNHDTKKFRVFVVVSRQALIDSKFSTVICAPIYSRFDGLSTQIEVDTEDGLKKTSSIFCDELLSIEKSRLTDFIGTLGKPKLDRLKKCLEIAVGIEF